MVTDNLSVEFAIHYVLFSFDLLSKKGAEKWVWPICEVGNAWVEK